MKRLLSAFLSCAVIFTSLQFPALAVTGEPTPPESSPPVDSQWVNPFSLTDRFIVKSTTPVIPGNLLGEQTCISSQALQTNLSELNDYYAVTLDSAVSPEAFIEPLRAIGIEIYPDTRLELASTEFSYGSDVTPAYYAWEENLASAQISSAGDDVLIALLDNGVDISHPSLQGHLVQGWDFFHDAPNTAVSGSSFGEAHGTHVAGIIAATAPDAQIMPLQVSEDGIAYVSTVISAIKYAEDHGAVIANCSWNTVEEIPLLKRVMAASPLVFITAAGNDGRCTDDVPVYPASFDLENVISVTSVDDNGALSYFSTYGSDIDLAARGNNIVSTIPGGGQGSLSGTSMATAYVSGAAALALSSGAAEPASLKSTLKATADQVEGLTDYLPDGGVLNFSNLVCGVVPSIPLPDLETSTYSTTTNDTAKVIEIAAGGSHFAVLKDNGEIWSWGWNQFGQLGDGTTTDSAVPRLAKYTALPRSGSDPGIHIYAGENNTYAESYSSIYGWGYNADGQIANGTRKSSVLTASMSNIYSVKKIVAANSYALFLKQDGTVWVTGSNQKGECGKPTDYNFYLTPMQVENLPTITDISGANHRPYALSSDRNLYNWGLVWWSPSNSGMSELTTPTLMKSNVSVMAGLRNNGVYVDTSRTPYGLRAGNDFGKLSFQQKFPTAIHRVKCGDSFEMYLDVDGKVWVTGKNNYGQLGIGRDTSYSTTDPVQVTALNNIISIAAAENTAIALQNDGTVWVWGSNAYGLLGNGGGANSNLPIRVAIPDINEIISGKSSGYYETTLRIPYGTKWEDISFPETANAPTYKSSYAQVPVQWNTSKLSNYDPHAAGTTYSVSGTYTSNSNPGNCVPTLKITISSAKIKRIENPSPITVHAGTTANQLSLPSQVTVYLDDDTPTELPVTWNTSSFDPTLSGAPQTMTGTLALVSGVTNPSGLTAQIDVIVNSTPKIESIRLQTWSVAQNIYLSPTEKENPFGDLTTESLPATAVAELSGGNTIELPVVWNTTSYDPSVTGLQTLTGEVIIADNLDIENLDDVKARLDITVLPKTYELWDADPLEISIEATPGSEIADLNQQLRTEGKAEIAVQAVDLETDFEVFTFCNVTLAAEDNPNYQKDVPGEYTLTARLPDNFTPLADDIPGPIQIKVTIPELTVTGIETAHMDAYQSVAPEHLTNIPAQVNVTLEGGKIIPVGATWDWSAYTAAKDTAGEHIVLGELATLPAYAKLPEGEDLKPAMVVNTIPVNYVVSGVLSDNQFDADAGLTLEEITAGLAPTLTLEITSTTEGVTLTTEYVANVSLEQEKNEDFDPEYADVYILTGTLTLPANITCPSDQFYDEIILQTLPVEILSLEPAYALADEGTPFAELNTLPIQVMATLSCVGSNGENKRIAIGADWGTGTGYNPLPDGLTDDNSVTMEIKGTLADCPQYVNGAGAEPTLVITMTRVFDLVSVSPSRIPETGAMEVKLRSSLEDIYTLLESHSAELTLQNPRGETSTATVTFTLREEDNSAYDAMTEGTYTLVGYLPLNEKTRNPSNLGVEIVVKPTKYTISSVRVTRVTGVVSGTPFEDVNMPARVTVLRNDKQEDEAPATWDGSNYNPTKIGSQKITGTLVTPLPVHLENPNNRQPSGVITIVNPTARILSLEQLPTNTGAMLTATESDFQEEDSPLIEYRYLAEILYSLMLLP